jgi:polyribonucleotide nucleotidyltransferase
MFVQASKEIGGRTLSIETGEIAKQADGAVIVKYGETVVLVTAVMSPRKEELDYLPLFVDYAEKTYSAGKIPGGYFKREGRPTETEILNGRLVDRPIRPLFPSGCRNQIQIIALALSIDKENGPGVLALIGASAALMISDIPWNGPIAGVQVGRIGGKLVINPTATQLAESDLDLTIAVGREGVVMVEGEAGFVPESVIVEALMFAQEQAQPLLALQDELARQIAPAKREIELPEEKPAIEKAVNKKCAAGLAEALAVKTKKARYQAIDQVLETAQAELAETYPDEEKTIERYFEALKKKIARGKLAETKRRIDGRETTEIRPISGRVGLLPRTHGSSLFTRGETQALVTATLGSAQDEQRIDSLFGDVRKRFMLHYNFPPFCTGEVKSMRGPSRRDIGHGHLAERGISRALPNHDDFSYTIRVVSEVMESNGSSSMATVCGTSMALMDAGVPMKCGVAGIAMGLIKEGEDCFVLSDILGDEDHLGDMDFKVVGNREGVSAVQMDIKISGLTREILETALEQARAARNHVLDKMHGVIETHRPELSPYAPRITVIHISVGKIGALIGPGGKNIRAIIEETGAAIDVDDEGRVSIAAVDQEAGRRAIELVQRCTAEAERGKIYTGKVVRIVDFGAFIEILPGIDGLCHISELCERRVNQVEDVLREGDEVVVKVIDIDERNGKVKLSRKQALRR